MGLFDKKEELPEVENRIINEIKALTLDIINNRSNGNLDFSLDLVETLYTLYSKHLNIDPKNSNYLNRDRLILSTSTGYPALLSTLYMSGYDISIDELKEEYPKKELFDGIDIIFDKQGNGLATLVGIAIAENYLNKSVSKELFNYNTYAIISDLDLIEDISYSSLSLAGTLKLDNLILLYDNNNESLGKNQKNIFNLDINKYFEALNFNVITVNKYNVLELDDAIGKAKDSDKPSIIILNQDNDKYKFENNYYDRKYLLTLDEISKIKRNLEVRDIPFAVSNEVKEAMENMISSRMKNKLNKYYDLENTLEENKKKIYNKLTIDNKLLDNIDLNYSYDENDLLEDIVIKIVTNLFENNELLIGTISTLDSILENKLANTNRMINLGLRENVIGYIQNGLRLAYLNNISISSIVTLNKMIPSILDASSLKLNNIYIFIDEEDNFIDGIDDNIFNGLNSLRSISNVDVFRPNDVNELIGSIQIALTNTDKSSCIIINRKPVTAKEECSIVDVKKGAYIVKNESKEANCILVSSGKELDLTLEIADNLITRGYDIRVVSIPSTSLFDLQRNNYQESILDNDKIFIIEKSLSNYWHKYVNDDNYIITSDLYDWYNSDLEYIEFKDVLIEYIENLL